MENHNNLKIEDQVFFCGDDADLVDHSGFTVTKIDTNFCTVRSNDTGEIVVMGYDCALPKRGAVK